MGVTVYNRTALTGGAARALDAISVASLSDGDVAFTQDQADSNKFYYHVFDATATTAESSPDYIRPDDYATQGVWIMSPNPYDTNLTIPSGSIVTGNIAGLNFSQDTDADHDILISVGTCFDSTNAYELRLTTAITKQLDAAFAAGDDAGGLFSGAVAANTVYNIFVIKKDSDGTIDAGFDTSAIAANIPAGYTYFRWIGYVITDSASNIIDFIYANNIITWQKASDMAVNAAGAVPAAYTAIDLSAWIPSVTRVSHVRMGGQASTGGQGIGLSNDGTNTHHTFKTVNASVGDTLENPWFDFAESEPIFMPINPTSTQEIFWGLAGLGSGSNADLRLHEALLVR